jgi:hypothetical protein
VLLCLQREVRSTIDRLDSVVRTFRDKVILQMRRTVERISHFVFEVLQISFSMGFYSPKLILELYFSQALVLVFCGPLVRAESFSFLNEMLLGKRLPLRTIHFPWSMNQTHLNHVFEVIAHVLQVKQCSTSERGNVKMFSDFVCLLNHFV